jgi:hypothetical protein
MTDQVATSADAVELTRRFTGAFNMRDPEALRQVLADDARFRTPQGRALTGPAGARRLLIAAEEANVRLEPTGDPRVDGGRVQVPVRVVAGLDAFDGTAVFAIRDGRVAEFEVVPGDS